MILETILPLQRCLWFFHRSCGLSRWPENFRTLCSPRRPRSSGSNTLVNDGEDCCWPSKIQSYYSTGKPLKIIQFSTSIHFLEVLKDGLLLIGLLRFLRSLCPPWQRSRGSEIEANNFAMSSSVTGLLAEEHTVIKILMRMNIKLMHYVKCTRMSLILSDMSVTVNCICTHKMYLPT